jgi:hypothetical protein
MLRQPPVPTKKKRISSHWESNRHHVGGGSIVRLVMSRKPPFPQQRIKAGAKGLVELTPKAGNLHQVLYALLIHRMISPRNKGSKT